MGRRARFGGRSSRRGSGGRPSGRYNRERYAAGGAHFSVPSSSSSSSDALELHQEFEKLYKNDFQCRFYYRQLLKEMADAVAVGGECFFCEDIKEKLKDCPGVEKQVNANVHCGDPDYSDCGLKGGANIIKVKFKNEGAPTQEELNKLTDQEFECRKFTEISKRDARNAEWFGLENNADHYTRILANLRCDDLKKKKEGGRWRWRWWWW